ncbi:MAG: nitroreductase family deazaflavin-dependent oxidoreductase [Streptosporangiaceae bacterium]|jgi:deazaflavin-dependent oxidoreductase (nitroreductase family)
MTKPTPHYQEPGWFTRNVLNKAIAGLTSMGVSVLGSRILAVRGRKSGEWRTTPVNLLIIDGQRYLVSPRGQTQWVRNLRVSHQGELRLGRRTEPFTATEVSDDDKPAILRAYLTRWKAEVGVFFGGVGPKSSEAELRRISPDHPVFTVASDA